MDPRDRIYGLLGITTHGTQSLYPDYKKSVEEVFMDTTRYILSQENPLNVFQIAAAGTPERRISENFPHGYIL